jgi:hypothetical protein
VPQLGRRLRGGPSTRSALAVTIAARSLRLSDARPDVRHEASNEGRLARTCRGFPDSALTDTSSGPRLMLRRIRSINKS